MSETAKVIPFPAEEPAQSYRVVHFFTTNALDGLSNRTDVQGRDAGVSAEHARETAKRTLGVHDADFDPAHKATYLGPSRGRYYFQVQLTEEAAAALQNHPAIGLVCRPDELEERLAVKPEKTYREVGFTHAETLVLQKGEDGPGAIKRLALEKFGAAAGLKPEDFDPARASFTGNAGRFFIFVESAKADALENSGHKDVIRPPTPEIKSGLHEKPRGPGQG